MIKKVQEAISELFYEQINAIDIQTESVLSKLNEKRDDNLNEIESINALRETYINKAQELAKFNLQNLSEKPKLKGCAIIPNVEMKISKKELGDLNICYANKLGILVTYVIFDMYETLDIIKEAVSKNVAIKEEDFKHFEDFAKVLICIDLINQQSPIDPFIDFSTPENNKLEELYFHCSHINGIYDSDFDFLPKFINVSAIKELELANDKLGFIPSGIFQNLNCLQTMSLYFDNIDSLWSFNFKPLSNLTKLDICNSSLTKIDKNAFNGLNNLKFLNLNENRIKNIDSETFNGLCNLESLWLDQNMIQVIKTDTFIHLKNLTALYLCMNKINRLEANCFNGLDKLKILRLLSNSMHLSVHETSFDSCVNLEALDLEHNNIVSYETRMFANLTNLKFLTLHSSETKQIELLQSFSKLEVLDIAETKFTKEQLNSLNFDNLRYLVCSFERVPQFGQNLKSLQALSIEGVTCFERNCFNNLENLEYMRLDIKFPEIMDSFNDENLTFYNNFKYFKLCSSSQSQTWSVLFERKKSKLLNLFDSKQEIELKESTSLTTTMIEIKTKECESCFGYFKKFLKASPNAIEAIFTCFDF